VVLAFFNEHVILAYVAGIILIYIVARLFLMPVKFVFKLIYNGIIGGALLWGVNFLGAYISFNMPITIWKALIAGFLGIPGVVGLILYKITIE